MGYDLLRLSSKNVHLGTEPGAFCHCVPGLHARVRPERIGGLIDCHFPLHDGAGGLHVPGRALDGFLACGSGGRPVHDRRAGRQTLGRRGVRPHEGPGICCLRRASALN